MNTQDLPFRLRLAMLRAGKLDSAPEEPAPVEDISDDHGWDELGFPTPQERAPLRKLYTSDPKAVARDMLMARGDVVEAWVADWMDEMVTLALAHRDQKVEGFEPLDIWDQFMRLQSLVTLMQDRAYEVMDNE